MKRKVIIVWMLMGLTVLLEAKIAGLLSVRTIYDSNVYNDSSNLNDFGLNSDFNLNLMAKLNNTYPRLNYTFSSLNFFNENFENQNNHFINGSLRQSLSGLFTVGAEGGLNVFQYSQLKGYNLTLAYGTPFLKLYPFYYTEIETGYIYKSAVYPDYDLDYTGGDIYVDFFQDLPLNFSIKLGVISGERKYSERYIYAISGGSKTDTSELREDKEKSFTVKLKKYFETVGSAELGYGSAFLDSNADEFYEGAEQSGDEKILQNYWNYKSDTINLSLKSGTLEKIVVELNGHYFKKDFDGWLARDEYEILISPYENRSDKQTIFSVKGEKEVSENFILSGRFLYENNESNDTPYNYISNVFELGVKLLF